MPHRIRPAAAEDIEPLVRMWGETKRDAYPYLPLEQARTFEEDLAFFTTHIVPRCEVWIATEGDEVIGYMAIAGDYLDRLYIHPTRQRRGIGTALLRKAMELSPAGLELHTHQKNTAACTFYERHGFRAVEYGVSPPPENEPDVRYRLTAEAQKRRN